jgi:hypothetical protein
MKKFSWRAFTSLYMVFSFIMMTISGIILYIAPPGRIAHWTQLTILGFTKTQWQTFHTSFTFLFIFAASLHLFYNWKPLMFYIRRKIKSGIQIKKELAAVTLVFSSLFVLIYLNSFPFKNIMDLSEYFSASWSNGANEPPIAHAELLTLSELALTLKISEEELISRLKKAAISTGSKSDKIQKIAEQNNMTPAAIYRIIINSNDSTGKNVTIRAGGGFGRKTIEQISQELNIPLADVINKLKTKGIKADAQVRLKDLANQYNMLPHEILEYLQTN